MPLSPIQLFRSNENSLAQILQGGNQTVSHIMDQAIQIGRDISNKQLSQEKDLAAMNVQQRAFDQRRAEAAQQDFEDQRRFARSAFESDRRYDLQMSQEARAGVKDLFAMQDASARTGLAERGVQLREDEFKYVKEQDRAELAAQAEAEKARQGEVSSLLSPSSEAPAEVAPVTAPPQKSFKGERIGIGIGATEGMSTDDRMRANNQVNPAYRKPVEDILKPQQPTTATPSMTREQAAGKLTAITKLLRDPKTTTAEAQRLGEEAERIRGLFPDTKAPKPLTPSEELAAKKYEDQKAEKSKKAIEEADAQALKEADPLFNNSAAFPTRKTKINEEWSEEYKARRLEDDKRWNDNLIVNEWNTAKKYKSAEEYANLLPGLSEIDKEDRRRLWSLATRTKQTGAPASPAASNPWDAVP